MKIKYGVRILLILTWVCCFNCSAQESTLDGMNLEIASTSDKKYL